MRKLVYIVFFFNTYMVWNPAQKRMLQKTLMMIDTMVLRVSRLSKSHTSFLRRRKTLHYKLSILRKKLKKPVKAHLTNISYHPFSNTL